MEMLTITKGITSEYFLFFKRFINAVFAFILIDLFDHTTSAKSTLVLKALGYNLSEKISEKSQSKKRS